LRKTCDGLACGNVVEKSAWNLWKCTRKLWNCLSQIFCSTLWSSSSLATDGRPFHSSSWTLVCAPIFEHSTPLSCSSFTHRILAINRA
jgi:hypothetical protein